MGTRIQANEVTEAGWYWASTSQGILFTIEYGDDMKDETFNMPPSHFEESGTIHIAKIPSPETCKAITDKSMVVVDADKLLMLIDHNNSTPKIWLKKYANVLSSSFPYDTFMSYFDDIEKQLTQQSEGGTDGN